MRQDEITKGVNVDGQDKDPKPELWALHCSELGEEKGPAKETAKEPSIKEENHENVVSWKSKSFLGGESY